MSYANKGQMQAAAIMGGLEAGYGDRQLSRERQDRLNREKLLQERWETAQAESALRFEATRSDAASRAAKTQENWEKTYNLQKTAIELANAKERTAKELADMQRAWLASAGDLSVASRILSAPLGPRYSAALTKDDAGRYIVTLSPGGSNVFARDDMEYVAKMKQLLGDEGYATSLFSTRLENINKGKWVTDADGYVRWVTPADSGKVKVRLGKSDKTASGKRSRNVSLPDLKSLMALYEQDATQGLVEISDGTGETLYMDKTGKMVPPADIQNLKMQARQDAELAASIMESTGASAVRARRAVRDLKDLFAARQNSTVNSQSAPSSSGPGQPGAFPPPFERRAVQTRPPGRTAAAPRRVVDQKTAEELLDLVRQVRSLHGTDFDEAGIKALILAGRIDEARSRLRALTNRSDIGNDIVASPPY